MMSPFWKPTLAAGAPSSRLTTTTPSALLSRRNSSATAGEMLATRAPWNGERAEIVISSRLVSGATSKGMETLTVLPLRCK